MFFSFKYDLQQKTEMPFLAYQKCSDNTSLQYVSLKMEISLSDSHAHTKTSLRNGKDFCVFSLWVSAFYTSNTSVLKAKLNPGLGCHAAQKNSVRGE